MKHDEQQQIQEFHSNLFKIQGFAEGKYVDYNDLSTRAADQRCPTFKTNKENLVTLYKSWEKFLQDASAEIKKTQGDTIVLQN
jgi:hypothetical protein